MFKKTEESEWTRFSKALGGRDQSREREQVVEPEDDLLEDEATAVSPPMPMPPAPLPAGALGQSSPSRTMPAEPELAPTQSGPATQMIEGRYTDYEPQGQAMLDGDAESVISAGTSVEGTFRSDHSIRVRGSLQGELESKRRVVIELDARVSAKIQAQQVDIAGEVKGEVSCPGRVEISPSGRVTGEINAGSLIMQDGAYFEGHLKMSPRGSQTASGDPEVNG